MENKKHIYIGSDHAGYELKEKLKIFLTELNYPFTDIGAFILDYNDDYPDFVKTVARFVLLNRNNFGIIIGASGQGEAICANRYNGIRAIVYYGGENSQTDLAGNELDIIKGGRQHNNANILSLGARFINQREAENAVRNFINTPFLYEDRHQRRINKIEPNN